MRGLRVLCAVAATAAACASPKPASDTTETLAAVDTLKPAVVATPDSVGASTTAMTPAPKPTTSTKATKATKATSSSSATKPTTGTKTTPPRDTALVARDTTHLGRDSVIRINPRDPLRKIPPVKPPVKPPR